MQVSNQGGFENNFYLGASSVINNVLEINKTSQLLLMCFIAGFL